MREIPRLNKTLGDITQSLGASPDKVNRFRTDPIILSATNLPLFFTEFTLRSRFHISSLLVSQWTL